MQTSKAEFLKTQFVALLKQISSDTLPHWGKMTLQQMAEHFADYVRIASGKTTVKEVVTQPEQLDKMRDFLMSEKPFKENTPNSLMPEVPPPVRNSSIAKAFDELETELNYFFAVFEEKHQGVTRNPFFGDLNYEQNVALLYKHALHHLKQFGVMV